MCPDKLLSVDEKRRNSRGKVFVYSYDESVRDTVASFNRDIGINDIPKCNSRVDIMDEPSSKKLIPFKPELIEGTQIPYPGFPSLNVLPIQSVELTPLGLNCFGMKSKYPNTILTLRELPQLPSAKDLAANIIGKSLFINWPMMHEARVVAVSDSECTVRFVKKKKKVRVHSANERQKWEEECDSMKQQYMSGSGQPGTGGVKIGEVQIRLKLVPLQGMKTSPSNGSKKKVFGAEEADVPIQMALWKSPAPDPRFEERGPLKLEDRFPAKSRVILTKGKHRGCIGEVLSVLDEEKVGVKVKVLPPEPPFGLAIARSIQESYIGASDASKVLKMNPEIFGKVTGSLFFNPGRYDLGLNLKYKKDFCVLGYTKRKEKVQNGKENKKMVKKAWGSNDTVLVVGNKRNGAENDDSDNKKYIWEYTPKAIRLVAAFKQEFPMLFAAISKNPRERSYDARILGPGGLKALPKIREWLNNVESSKLPRTPCSTKAMPFSAINAVQRAADVRVSQEEMGSRIKDANIKIPSSALYKEGSTSATDVLSAQENDEPELGDRVVNLCADGIPFGARGTIVSIHEYSTGCVEVVMDKEFIGGSILQGACSNFRGKLCVWNHLLKVSASNSVEIVDQMIPAGAGKALVDNILNQESNGEQVDVKRETPVKPDQNNSDKVIVLQKGEDSKPISSTPRASKQGAWREASRPTEKGIGFKGSNGIKDSGLQKWFHMQSMKEDDGRELNTSAAAAGLKALLGVNGATEAETKIDSSISDATRGLKTMLGVPASSVPVVPPPASTSAADALFQLMVQSPGMAPAPQMPVPSFHPPQPRFNFTYVKEGDTEPMAPQGINPYQMHPPFPMGQYPMPMVQNIPVEQVQGMHISVNGNTKSEEGTSSNSGIENK